MNNKFYGLVITSDIVLKRMWLDNAQALEILSQDSRAKIYRPAVDQESRVVEIDGEKQIMWVDVPTVETL